METRRKEVGKHIKAARRRKGYRSQAAFAEAIGVHESSVAFAETGSSRTGSSVYGAIEDGLEWPTGSILAYIDGRQGYLPGAPEPAAELGSSDSENELTFTVTEKDRKRWRTMTTAQIIEEGQMIGRTISERMQRQYLRAALAELDTLDRERA
jgi:DNA-binding XRE family transcriptional regulator